ncbi:flagellar basal body rod protein FlgB [Caldithrix abyssi]|uniref:Flagellar basal body rod protein FlgB n=1 Tax=Caldithrix abyssi DSM 13497 TaxID=880073 RepID=H1XPC4_CALAY|nr:flagellar basal body rod protein FlgB [Caldithrix abyssi]APF18214.1 flagellar basal-body rod protein FlgB [Caldithrix abyssi DSM 13497]EHO42239.1 flagellar basal-body rod protein FlgB [Caldithrix abyssi DSM 13497]
MRIFELQNLNLLKKSLDVYTRQHEAIAKNIANANNPNYKRVNTDFSSELKARLEGVLKTEKAGHIAMPTQVHSKLSEKDAAQKEVDLTREMGALAENQIRFEFASKVLAGNYRLLSQSITGRSQ